MRIRSNWELLKEVRAFFTHDCAFLVDKVDPSIERGQAAAKAMRALECHTNQISGVLSSIVDIQQKSMQLS